MKKQHYQILHADPAFFVINKPAGIPSIPGFASDGQDLYSQLKQRHEEVFIVHRIDADTSGLILFARNREAHRQLSMRFEKRKIRKTYLAFTRGIPSPQSGEIEAPLKSLKKGIAVVSLQGKPALTAYRVLEVFKQHALVEAIPLTGRMHQIRVHFQSLHTPLVADRLYGRQHGFFVSEIKGRSYRLGKDAIEKPLVARTALHAWKLSFEHPMTQSPVDFEAPLPKDLKALLHQLRKWSSTE